MLALQPFAERLFAPVFSAFMLLFPLIFVLGSRTTAEDQARRAAARAGTRALALATTLALSLSLGLFWMASSSGRAWAAVASGWTWVLFFPLWFGLAAPALGAKNPAWLSVHAGGSSNVRSAALASRRKRSPLGRGHWLALGVSAAALLAALAARGLRPFDGPGQRERWLWMTGAYALTIAVTLTVTPFALRAALSEPEPMDAQGSPELARLYDAYRSAKVRGLFALSAALSLGLGIAMVALAWTELRQVGVLGAWGGAAVGIAGACFGTWMSVWRVRIAELKAKLDAGGA